MNLGCFLVNKLLKSESITLEENIVFGDMDEDDDEVSTGKETVAISSACRLKSSSFSCAEEGDSYEFDCVFEISSELFASDIIELFSELFTSDILVCFCFLFCFLYRISGNSN